MERKKEEATASILSGYLPLISILKIYVERKQKGESPYSIEERCGVKIHAPSDRRINIKHEGKEVRATIKGHVVTATFNTL